MRDTVCMDTETIELLPTVARGCCDLPPSLRLDAAAAEQAAAAFKAIGHPVRLQILDLLSRFEGQVCVCDIEAQFSLSQPTISHHLRILREAGLVGVEPRGLWNYYFVRRPALDVVRSMVSLWAGSA